MRLAGSTDVAAVTALVRDAYGHYVPRIGVTPGPMRTDYAAAIADRAVWVEEGNDGRLVGVLVLRVHADHLLLENVAVHPEAQHRGIGRALIDVAEQRARDLQLSEVRLFTHELMSENIALYARLGYAETHRRNDNGLRRVFFTKRLGA